MKRSDALVQCGILLLSRLYCMRSAEVKENHIEKYLHIYGNSFYEADIRQFVRNTESLISI